MSRLRLNVPFRGKLRQRRVSTTTVLLPFSELKNNYVKKYKGGAGVISSGTAFSVLAIVLLELFTDCLGLSYYSVHRHKGPGSVTVDPRDRDRSVKPLPGLRLTLVTGQTSQ